jgi:hypothetical protein
LRELRLCLWLVAAAAGVFHAWVYRYAITADGVSYLDVADAYFRGDWNSAINGYWSPLYSWLVGLALFLFKPEMRWEYPVAHLVSLIIFFCAVASFNYFLHNLIRYHHAIVTEGGIPEWVFLLTGHFIFLWSTLALVPFNILNPDILVAAIVYLIGGILIRIRLGDFSPGTFALLGITLGLGYLSKTVMFLGAFIFLAVSLLLVRGRGAFLPCAAFVFCCFLLIAAPFVTALSRSKGRLTYGDAGKLAYAWIVSGVKWAHWQGERIDWGIPAHTSRRIFDSPAVYEFGGPLLATYPIWYDPSYWYEGVATHFNMGAQARVVIRHLKRYARIFSCHGLLIFTGLCAFLATRSNRQRFTLRLVAHWWLLAPSVSMMMIYALVHVEARLVSPFIVTILLVIISSLSLPALARRRGWALTMLFLILALSIGSDVYRALTVTKTFHKRCLDVAEEVRNFGILPGEKIASITSSYLDPDNFNSKWARLAKLRIVAEIIFNEDVENYWRADGETKLRVMDAFRQTGAVLVVAESFPPGVSALQASADGWRPVAQTGVYVYFL